LLFFNSNRTGGPGGTDIYVSARRPDGSFGAAELVEELSSPFQDLRAVVRSDGLETFLFSDRPGTLGDYDLWVSTRNSVSDPWTPPVNLGAPVNGVRPDQQAWLASDRRTLYFASSRPGGIGGLDLYVTTRANRPPGASAGGPVVGFEGKPTTFDASDSSDPDGDPLQFRWDFTADGTWDTLWSSDPTALFTFPDDFSGTARLEVSDGTSTATAEASVTIRNVAPSVDAGPAGTASEGSTLSFSFAFADSGFDSPTMGSVEDFTATVDWGYGPSESPAVNEVPGSSGVPTSGTISVTHTYGDDGAFTVTVTVCDDDGGCGADTTVVTTRNVDPVIDDVQAYVLADVRLRVAGEKWHDVRMDLVWNGGVTGTARVVRYPGSPDDQSATIEDGRLQLLGDFAITLYYTPDDDPVNRNGANPAWVILTMPDGSEVRLHHTFNVQHAATWTIDDLRPYVLGQEITFEATASDVGSDDLTIAWDFGDGATARATDYNDGVGPDSFPSPEVNPIAVRDAWAHEYAAPGPYTVTLRVTDDDGGTASSALVLYIGT